MFAKTTKVIKFGLSTEEFELLERNMKFYNCKTRGEYFRLKLKTDNVLYEDLRRSTECHGKRL